MRNKSILVEEMKAFFVCTTCITILEGILGMLFFPQMKLGYDAFFSPPIFGLFSVLFGFVNYSKKELSVRQVLFRRFIHLLMIEGLVFGLNYASGMIFLPFFAGILAVSIALVFIAVYAALWFMDRRSAMLFNEQLKRYQSRES